jgi:hypothetical protein
MIYNIDNEYATFQNLIKFYLPNILKTTISFQENAIKSGFSE